jgi:solute carrier family 25 (mitochondrial thiamine pyrophosphate transporter), member 19
MQGLWRGTVPGLAMHVPYCAAQFMTLQQCKAFIRQHGWDTQRLATASSFVGGATAGAVATLASYPFDLLRTVLASQGSPPLYRGMVHAAADLVQKRGVLGLFSGVGITLTEIVPYAGVQFGVYDLLMRLSAQDKPATELSPQAAFGRQFLIGLLAGFAGKVR